MRFFRDAALLRRALGAAIVFALAGLWAKDWREDIASGGSYATDTLNAASNLMYTFLALAIVAMIYVAVCLMLTPRTGTKPVSAQDQR